MLRPRFGVCQNRGFERPVPVTVLWLNHLYESSNRITSRLSILRFHHLFHRFPFPGKKKKSTPFCPGPQTRKPSLPVVSSEKPCRRSEFSGKLDFRMVSPENSNWLFEYPLIEDISVPDGNFTVPASGFSWPAQALIGSSNGSVEMDGALGDSDCLKESGSKKRGRSDSCAASSSKACREKLRRDRLNDKFLELGSILEPGRPPKTDKAAVLIDAVRMVTQLRGEAQKLKDSNMNLQEKIKELKAEKNELRDEKQRLKSEKEKLEQQLKAVNAQPGFLPPPPAIPAAFTAQGQPPGSKLVPFIGYPGVAMWQFMPPAAVDTSQDHVLRPPVA